MLKMNPTFSTQTFSSLRHSGIDDAHARLDEWPGIVTADAATASGAASLSAASVPIESDDCPTNDKPRRSGVCRAFLNPCSTPL
jgi:hypothetical protein